MSLSRIQREKKTVRVMIDVYCRKHHSHARRGNNLCAKCQQLADYATQRLDRCPHGNAKPTCQKCSIHCYAPSQKQAIRGVMRYAGPRMTVLHPVMAIRHLLGI